MPKLENTCEDTIELTIVYRATELLAPGWGQWRGVSELRIRDSWWPSECLTLTWTVGTTGTWEGRRKAICGSVVSAAPWILQ